MAQTLITNYFSECKIKRDGKDLKHETKVNREEGPSAPILLKLVKHKESIDSPGDGSGKNYSWKISNASALSPGPGPPKTGTLSDESLSLKNLHPVLNSSLPNKTQDPCANDLSSETNLPRSKIIVEDENKNEEIGCPQEIIPNDYKAITPSLKDPNDSISQNSISDLNLNQASCEGLKSSKEIDFKSSADHQFSKSFHQVACSKNFVVKDKLEVKEKEITPNSSIVHSGAECPCSSQDACENILPSPAKCNSDLDQPHISLKINSPERETSSSIAIKESFGSSNSSDSSILAKKEANPIPLSDPPGNAKLCPPKLETTHKIENDKQEDASSISHAKVIDLFKSPNFVTSDGPCDKSNASQKTARNPSTPSKLDSHNFKMPSLPSHWKSPKPTVLSRPIGLSSPPPTKMSLNERTKIVSSPKSLSSPIKFVRGSSSPTLDRNYTKRSPFKIEKNHSGSLNTAHPLSSPKVTLSFPRPKSSPHTSPHFKESPHVSSAPTNSFPFSLPPRSSSPSISSPNRSSVRKILFPSTERDHERDCSPTKRSAFLVKQSPSKKNKVEPKQLKPCSSLSDLQQQVASLQGFKENMASLQTSSPVKLPLSSPVKLPTSPLRSSPFTVRSPMAGTIRSTPPLARKKKSFLDRLNDSIEKHRKHVSSSPTKQSPATTFESPQKILYSPRKVELKAVVDDLGKAEVSSSLEIPTHFHELEELFHATDTVVSLYHSRKEVCTFSKLRTSLRTMLQKKVEEADLGKLKTVYPQAYSFSKQKVSMLSSPRAIMELVVSPNFPEGALQVLDVKSLLQRRKHFKRSLVPFVYLAHQEFLSQHAPSLRLPLSQLTHWHPDFKLDSVPDIVPTPLLDLPPSEEIPNTEQSSPSTPRRNLLKGISEELLDKIRSKEATRALRIMKRTPEEDQDLKMLERLPTLVPIIYNYFLMERKTSLLMDELCRRVAESHPSLSNPGYIEQHIHFLAKMLPDWVKVLTLSSGAIYLKAVDKSCPLGDLLRHLEVIEKSYYT